MKFLIGAAELSEEFALTLKKQLFLRKIIKFNIFINKILYPANLHPAHQLYACGKNI
jgi:hypothetical protein